VNHSRTPPHVSDEIMELCRELVRDPSPRFLSVDPLPNVPANECFPVVRQVVAERGGSVCHGWLIWEWPTVMIEAEFHAVWQDPQGQLHDITPKPFNQSRVLFLPDGERVHQGRQVDNRRRALSPHADVKEFFGACEALFEFMNRGERANQHGELVVKGAEADEYAALAQRKQEAYDHLVARLPRPGRNDPCSCGSGRKYKKCHGA